MSPHKTPQLLALKSAERFIKQEVNLREGMYLAHPTYAGQFSLSEALGTLRIIQWAIVEGETAGCTDLSQVPPNRDTAGWRA